MSKLHFPLKVNLTLTLKNLKRNLIRYKSNCYLKENRGKPSNYKQVVHTKEDKSLQKVNQTETENNVVSSNYDDIFNEIAKGDPKVEKKLRKLELEMTVLENTDFLLPSKVKLNHWQHLLTLDNLSDREKYLLFLRLSEEKRKIEDLKEKEIILLREIEEREALEKGEICYSYNSNSLFEKPLLKSMIWLYTEKLIRAKLYSQAVVFDCSYEDYMSEINIKTTAHQLIRSFVCNRNHAAPFHVHLCNVNSNSACLKYFNKYFHSSTKSDFMWDIHEKSFLDLYPKNKIVYLTPDAKKELKFFSHDDIYVIGAFVDNGNSMKISAGKAKEAQVRTAKFPLDLYLKWEKGSKSLGLNIVMNILLDMRLYQNWNVAFKRIPSYFLTPSNQNLNNSISYCHDKEIEKFFSKL